jgi:N,N-dimethylformamidase
MTRLTGYVDPWTVAPGETLRVMVDAEGLDRFDARLVRLISPDPGGEIHVPSAIEGSYGARRQSIAIGSYLEVADGGRFPRLTAFTIAIWVFPTLLGREQALVAKLDPTGGRGFALWLDPEGRPRLAVGSGAVSALQKLAERRWSHVVASFDGETGKLTVAVDGNPPSTTTAAPLPPLACAAALLIAAMPQADGRIGRNFEGRLEGPLLLAAATPSVDPEASPQALPGLVAAWEFSREIGGDTIVDVGPLGFHGRAVNLPTRAVRGRRWRGEEMRWSSRPDEYAAIHFHGDDLYDANWSPDLIFTVPEGLPSGVYAAALSAPVAEDFVPFFVPARRPAANAKLALWLPTFSYLAYANDHCPLYGSNPEVLANRLIELHPGDLALAAHPEFGLSLYDTHEDGSGVVFSSRRRPVLTLRHRQRAWNGGLPGGHWNFAADLQIVAWLEAAGIDYEIITDEMIELSGAELLGAYRAVVTGSHPEYLTLPIHDAVARYLKRGGRLAYLGGNGFYWRVATSAAWPGAIELRRAEDGNRSWAAEPGEYYHAFDGTYGGLWRRNGRPPQALVGTGYTAQGFIRARAFRRTAESFDPRVAFAFSGVPADEPLGTCGANGGGAAGIEIDRADPLLGTPRHALVVATADGFDDSYFLANEEILVNRPTVTGDLTPLIRADMVFFETPAGGAVFSVGSIAWAGALGDPTVGRLTENVVRRFLDAAPFPFLSIEEDR